MQDLLLVLIAVTLIVLRLFVTTVGHSWPMVFIVVSHVFVGVMLLWSCLLMPSLLEAAMFFLANG